MSKNPKRPRSTKAAKESPNTSPFTYELIAKGGRADEKVSTTVTLSIPAAEEECPLTLEPIAQSKLDFLPDTPFVSDRPLHSKLTLPCGHSFHALTLVYSFCKSGMVCPFCRAGNAAKADPAFLPDHFRAVFAERIGRLLEEERREDEADAAAMGLVLSITIPFQVMAEQGHITMALNHVDATGRMLFGLSSPMIMGGPRILVPRTNLSVSPIQSAHIQINITMRMPELGNMTIDSSRVLHIHPGLIRPGTDVTVVRLNSVQEITTRRSDGSVLAEQVNRHTLFKVVLARRGGGVGINTIIWNPGSEAMEILAGSGGE